MIASAKHTGREKRNLLIISILIFFIISLTFLETYLQGVEFSSRLFTNNIIVFAIVNLNIVLLMILLFLIMRNLIKLYFERRQKILGYRFKTKLVVSFIAISIIPTIILFVSSLNLIHKSIRNWFEIRVEDVLKGTTQIATVYYQNLSQNSLYFARRIGNGIDRQWLLETRNIEALTAFLRQKQVEYNLSLIEVYTPDLNLLAFAAMASTPRPGISTAARKSMTQALQGLDATLTETAGSGDVIRTIAPIFAGDTSHKALGVLLIDTFIPSSVMQQARNITSTYESYRQSKILKSPIRVSYQMTLLMITLLVVFSATWFAFYLTRVITGPVQKLAEGTRRVSDGDLNFKIEATASDELGMLINSFNRMTEDLKANKSRLEAAYQHLEKNTVELEARNLYIETVLDNIATGVISLDEKGRLTTVNKAAQAMLNINAAEWRGKPYHVALTGDAFSEARSFVDDLFSGNVNWLEKKIDLGSEGNRLNLLLIGSNLYDDAMAYAGTVIVIENLTELINAQRLAAWREVARRIAHEIKNPLTPIKLSAQRLRKKFFQKSPDFDGVFDEATQIIIGQVDEMKKLVDEFTHFARMPSSKPTPTDINAILESTLKLYRDAYKEMSFVTGFWPEPLIAMVDADQMKRAFINLIDNGIEATDKRGAITVETVYEKNSRSIKILFRDDGRGIPPDIRDKLFVPYFSTKKEGTGLGLSIVNSIVSDHSGYIRVKDNYPHGSVFIIELPAFKGDAIKV